MKINQKNLIPSDYYFVKPTLDIQYHVDNYFQLSNKNEDYNKFEFFYIADKDCYFINMQSIDQSVRWNGNTGVGNLVWTTQQNTDDESMLWIVELVADDNGSYMIHNKKDSTMVWDVHNYEPTLGGAVKLEKEHASGDIHRKAQLFALDIAVK